MAQKKAHVFTSDVDHFWVAYDSISTTNDSGKQINYIQKLYIDRGTPGLKAFMESRDYTAANWVKLIRAYPRFWNSIRPNTLQVPSKAKEIDASIERFRSIYPQLKEAYIYFTIGGLNSGGTTWGNKVLVGSEIATGTPQTDVSELPGHWLKDVFASQDSGNLVRLNIHEYVHTQQKGEGKDVLSVSLREGAADFITELVMAKPLELSYINYGRSHEEELKALFKREMFTDFANHWLYNGIHAEKMADLGYFMGYAICKSFYEKATDKKKAVAQIIELDYAKEKNVDAFLNQSGYYAEKINRQELLNDFRSNQPLLVRIEPLAADSLLDASVDTITLVFSLPMSNHVSINEGPGGKEQFPFSEMIGFSEDHTRLRIKTKLLPGHEYAFEVTNYAFASAKGYPLRQNYPIRFRTRP